MRPTIINAHLGEDENLLMLFVSYAFLNTMNLAENPKPAFFADKLTEKGYEVIEYKPASIFQGFLPNKDGGYAYLINEDSCKSEKQLLDDIYQIKHANTDPTYE